jgi:methionine synthase II (cobalamin-independent)
MERRTERILTTHVGSLPRPVALDDALKLAVSEVVKRQAEVGLDAVDDGEYGKSSWTGYLSERLSGFEARPVPPGGQVPRWPADSERVESNCSATRRAICRGTASATTLATALTSARASATSSWLT